jgi:predicted RNA binding protein YcfA (HicA-like mRNA interferase family)
MSQLTPVHWKKFEKFVLYVGCHFERQKGDHRIYWRSGLKRPVVFPADKEVPVFIIRNNLRTLGISIREYSEIMEKL